MFARGGERGRELTTKIEQLAQHFFLLNVVWHRIIWNPSVPKRIVEMFGKLKKKKHFDRGRLANPT